MLVAGGPPPPSLPQRGGWMSAYLPEVQTLAVTSARRTQSPVSSLFCACRAGPAETDVAWSAIQALCTCDSGHDSVSDAAWRWERTAIWSGTVQSFLAHRHCKAQTPTGVGLSVDWQRCLVDMLLVLASTHSAAARTLDLPRQALRNQVCGRAPAVSRVMAHISFRRANAIFFTPPRRCSDKPPSPPMRTLKHSWQSLRPWVIWVSHHFGALQRLPRPTTRPPREVGKGETMLHASATPPPSMFCLLTLALIRASLSLKRHEGCGPRTIRRIVTRSSVRREQ